MAGRLFPLGVCRVRDFATCFLDLCDGIVVDAD
jgi:hypothetical protein